LFFFIHLDLESGDTEVAIKKGGNPFDNIIDAKGPYKKLNFNGKWIMKM